MRHTLLVALLSRDPQLSAMPLKKSDVYTIR